MKIRIEHDGVISEHLLNPTRGEVREVDDAFGQHLIELGAATAVATSKPPPKPAEGEKEKKSAGSASPAGQASPKTKSKSRKPRAKKQ